MAIATTERERLTDEERPVRLAAVSIAVLTTAELAECTCPEYCERDHELD